MRSPFLKWSQWSRLLALQALALATLLQLGACKGDDDSTPTKDSGGFTCVDDHANADHANADAAASDHANADTDSGSDHAAADHNATEVGPPSGATCPKDNTLTYDNFGKGFMAEYCTRCHSSKLTDCNKRMGAPFEHDFDTFPGIIAVADHIDEKAAAGPDSTNTTMPKNGKMPSLDERKKLGQWLACELAKVN